MDAQRVQHELARAGVTVSEDQATLLLRHAMLLAAANQKLNLTRLTTEEDVIALHIVDSLAFIPRIEALRSPVVDIGSGGGFPGIPMAILGFDVVLCESVQKKARFLEECVEALGLGAEVLPIRAEELATCRPGTASSVVVRAVASLPALVELGAPLLKLGGCLVALKGTPSEAEFSACRRAAEICGMTVERSVAYELPSGHTRTAVVCERVGEPQVQLPRRAGMAQKSPFGLAGA